MAVRFMVLCGVFSIATGIFLSGCAGERGPAGGDEQRKSQTAGLPREEFNWQEEKFAELLDITEGSPVYITDVKEDLVRDPDFAYDYEYNGHYDFYGDKVYIFKGYYLNETEGHRYFLNTYDLNTKETQCREFMFDIPRIPDFNPAHFAVAGEDKFVFFAGAYDEEDNTQNYYAALLSGNGELLGVTDIYPAMLQMGIQLQPHMILEGIVCDEQGLMYLCSPDMPQVGVIDEEGTLVDVMELHGAASVKAVCVMKSPEGIPIFEVSDMNNGKNTMFRYASAKKGIGILAETAYENVAFRGMDQYGKIYYRLLDDLICWNARTGTREKIFDCKGNGVNGNNMLQRLICSSMGDLFLVDLGKECIYQFSDEEPEKNGDKIRIADLCSGDDYIKSGAASFSRKYPAYSVEYEGAYFNERQAYHDRIMAEITAGNGPEILVLNSEDMKALNEKGALADITPMISDSVKEQLLPGSLKAGMLDDKLLGITYRVETATMYTSKDIWEKDTWTLEEFINRIEEKEKSGMQNVFAGVSNLSPYHLFYDMVMNDLQNSPFIDWEEGKCSFDCELFYKTIAIAEKYGVEYDGSIVYRDEEEEKQLESLKKGEALVYIADSVNSFDTFSRIMAILGEEYFCVGYPTEGTSGNYWNGWYFLAVNKAAEDSQAVKDYIDYFFDKERQAEWSLRSLRRDVLEEAIRRMQNPTWDTIAQTSDGTTYFEDYVQYLESCVSIADKGNEGILRIIDGEIKEYFAGAKGTEQTVEAIQNRVQLYLDENK